MEKAILDLSPQPSRGRCQTGRQSLPLAAITDRRNRPRSFLSHAGVRVLAVFMATTMQQLWEIMFHLLMCRAFGARSAAAAGRFEMTPILIKQLLRTKALQTLGLILLTLPWWASGIAKLFDLPSALAEAEHFGLRPTVAVVALTIFVQIAGSLLVVLGRTVWLGAGALGVFTIAATIVAHPFWQVADAIARFHDRNTFLEHIALIGGLILAAVLSERAEPT
jgi:transmembrane protein